MTKGLRKRRAKLAGTAGPGPEKPAHTDDLRDWMVGKSRVQVGRYTYGHSGLIIRQWREGAGLFIGQFCSIASDVTILLGGNHRTDWITTFPFGHIYKDDLANTQITGHPTTKGDIRIGNDVWIGAGATILSGVTIGDGAVISAQAMVTRDVAPYSIVGGNPAKPIALRFPEPIVALLQALSWWDLPLPTIVAIAPKLCAAPTEQSLRDLIAETAPPPKP